MFFGKKLEFANIALIAVITLALFYLCFGFGYGWNFHELGLVGDFFGGLANAVALALVAYGLHIQQKEYTQSIHELTQQTEMMKFSSEAQMFNLLYSTLIQRSSDFSYTDPATLNPPIYNGISALEHLLDKYNQRRNNNNLRLLTDRRSAIEGFVRTYLQTLKYIRSITDLERRRTLADLVLHQFISPIHKILGIETGNEGRIGLPLRMLTELDEVRAELVQTLAE